MRSSHQSYYIGLSRESDAIGPWPLTPSPQPIADYDGCWRRLAS